MAQNYSALPASPSTLVPPAKPLKKPDLRQIEATIPTHDIWVAASAGSGKTTVLINRVLRLMLPQKDAEFSAVAPHKIICITFTKAAAAQMSLRIQKKLGEWATMQESDLMDELATLTQTSPDDAMIKAARELFSRVLDTPGGLAIMTIHSFCQSVLARFPVEAGISPGFDVIEERAARDYLSNAIYDLISDIESGQKPAIEPAFSRIARISDLERLKQVLMSLSSQQDELSEFCRQHGLGETLRKNLLAFMGYDPQISMESITLAYVQNRDLARLRELSTALCASTTNNIARGQYIADWIAKPPEFRAKNLSLYRPAFFRKDKDEPYSITKKFIEKNPELYEIWRRESEELLELFQTIGSYQQAAQTADFITLAQSAFENYRDYKRRRHALDFEDLITKTYHLLHHAGQDWVHYKLDEGIDHILLDESQDTNPYQWQIIRKLCEEFTSGWGRETRHERSIFVVGDKKQSIYSFHGADPDVFEKMNSYFRAKSESAQRVFNEIRLDKSYRTTSPVLQLVDEVFAPTQLAKSIGMADGDHLQHTSNRTQDAGLVEIWDLPELKKPEKQSQNFSWDLPFILNKQSIDSPSKDSPSKSDDPPDIHPHSHLALRMAHHISHMIDTGEQLASQARAIEPRDILILVRTRNGPFVTDLIRQLKLLQIPVSGIDRMSLRDQIAVEDCLALARFCRFPADDLSLACLLKSPFIRLSEEEVMRMCLARAPHQSLWDYMRTQVNEELIKTSVDWLNDQIFQARHHSAFTFFDRALSCACPAAPKESARFAFATFLGPDCIDPLDEFLEYCRKKQNEDICSLESIVTSLEKHPVTIKRDQEDPDKDSGNQVRIMTVHAAKGLESPIVYLPDTVTLPLKSKITPFLWVNNDHGVRFPLWRGKSTHPSRYYLAARDDESHKAYDEYLRLLYVAMTRPRDRLYICGPATLPTRKNLDQTWYGLISAAFERLESAGLNIHRIDDCQTYQTPQLRVITKHDAQPEKIDHAQMPHWLKSPPPSYDVQTFIQPSQLGGAGDTALSPLHQSHPYRFERGILTHRLFQFLPDIAPDLRAGAAEKFLKKSAQNLPPEICTEIQNEVLTIMNDPVFSAVFSPNSFAEVAVAGEISPSRILSGQIDRLVVEDTRVLIVDYKTNRPSPRNSDDIPPAYREQLRAYKNAVAKIYPTKTIHCALLWTDRAILMPIEI